MSWYDIPEPRIQWLFDGLITADGHAAVVGKPKAGKSTFIRNMIAAVIKGRKFLGRSFDLPANTGRVLYVHLDRKDQDWRVTRDLKQLGITQEESDRLIVRTAEHMKMTDFSERLEWLKKEVTDASPNLVVIDLLWQFVVAKNSNDYNAVLGGINALQDALRDCKYKGALVVALHGRKANSQTDQFDDVLGSTGQRGSFSTLIMLLHRRKEKVYTISSDQTDRDDLFGEIEETVISRNVDGTLQLGHTVKELEKEQKNNKFESAIVKLNNFVTEHPGVDVETLMAELRMSKRYILDVIAASTEFLRREGTGKKGDPYKYFPKIAEEPAPQSEPIMATT